MKKVFAFLLAILLVFGLAMPAFAAEQCKLTITDGSDYGEDRSYAGYQLMTVTVSADGANFDYVVKDAYKSALISALGLASTADNKAIVDAVAAIADKSEEMHHFTDNLYRLIKADTEIAADATWTGATQSLDHGYWLIVDTTNLVDTKYANSLVMVDTLFQETLTIHNKPKSTTGGKDVDDENDSLVAPKVNNEDETAWTNVADYDIGDSVPFRIYMEASNDIAEYEEYKFVMCDSVGQGLTYLPSTFELYVNGENVTAKLAKAGTDAAETASFVYEIETDVDDAGVQTAQRLYLYPNYSYTTEAGETKEPNSTDGGDFLKYFPEGTDHKVINGSTVRLVYKCELNENANIGATGNKNEYTLIFSNNPYNKDSKGKTPKDVNIVFTYKVVINKITSDQKPLKGAMFTLYKFIPETPDASLETDEAKEAAGYYYHPSASAWGKYHELDTVELDSDVEGEATIFGFKGVDDGWYKLEETKKPDGYNAIAPIEFQITASNSMDTSNNGVIETLEGTGLIGGAIAFEPDTGAGTLTADVINKSGSELPTTGGMGTTLFYVFGSLMFVGAAVLLVTKKRMAY